MCFGGELQVSPLHDMIQKGQRKEIEVPVTVAKSHYKTHVKTMK